MKPVFEGTLQVSLSAAQTNRPTMPGCQATVPSLKKIAENWPVSPGPRFVNTDSPAYVELNPPPAMTDAFAVPESAALAATSTSANATPGNALISAHPSLLNVLPS